jgi:methyl-accepting chemotaxis protein
MIQIPPPIPPSEIPVTPGFIVAAVLASLPIVAVLVWGAVKVLGPISQALARRIGGHADVSDDMKAELTAVHQEMGQLREQLAEMQERLDFTERLLARSGAGARLPGGE